MNKTTFIIYFEREGRENLTQVLRALKKALTKRPELRSLKIVMLTANGEGPALAYARLADFEPHVIAVTFPPGYSVKRGEEIVKPEIPEKLRIFFQAVGFKIITARLPFDPIANADHHNADMRLIQNVLRMFGGGFHLCVQAVLSACDHGELALGERVIAVTGDIAAIITASTTEKFLSAAEGLAINEILCKPRNLTLTRKEVASTEGKPTIAEHPRDRVIDMPALPESKRATKKPVG